MRLVLLLYCFKRNNLSSSIGIDAMQHRSDNIYDVGGGGEDEEEEEEK